MKKKQLTAILLSAILSLSACMPVSGISAFAAEDEASQTISEEAGAAPETGNDEADEEEESVSEGNDADEVLIEAPAEGEATEAASAAGAEEEMPGDPAPAAEGQEETVPQENSVEDGQIDVPLPEESTNDRAVDSVQDNSAEGEGLEETSDPAQNNGAAGDGQQVDAGVPAEGQEGDTPGDGTSNPEDIFANAEEIQVGDSFNVSLTEEGPYVCFKFIPEEDVTAMFNSDSDVETYVELYDAEYNVLSSENGYNNFNLTYSFTAGSVYYFKVGASFFQGAAFSVSFVTPDFYVDHNNEGDIYTNPGEPVTLQVHATSGSDLTYSWSVNGESVQEGEADSYTYTPTERTEISCFIQDQNGHFDYINYFLYITKNWWIEQDGDGIIQVDPGQSRTISVLTSYTEGNEILYSWTYTWTDSEGNILQENSTDPSYTVPEVNGSALIYCTAQDQYGNQDKVSFVLHNSGWLNVYPEGVDLGNNSVNKSCEPGDSVDLNVIDATSGEIPIHYTWYNENDEELDGSEDSSYYQLTDVRKSCTIRCHAQDGDGNSADLYFYVRVNSYLTAYPEGGSEGETQAWIDITDQDTVTLRTIAENSAGGAISYQWRMLSYDHDAEAWQEEWIDISGATGNAYTVDQPRWDVQYCCAVEDEDGNRAEIVFQLGTDIYLLAYTSEDSFSTSEVIDVREMEEVMLAPYIASGNPEKITYQWACLQGQDEQILEGETGSTYTVSAPENGNTYICTVQDSYGSRTRLQYHFRQDNHLWVYTDEEDVSGYKEIDPRSAENFTLAPYVQADDTSQLQYSWKVNSPEGEVSDAGNGTTLIIDHQPLNNTTYYCTVSDQYGNSADVTYSFRIDSHLTAYPEGTREGISSVHRVISGMESVTLTAVVNADAETNYSWQWQKNSESVDSESGSIQSTGSETLSIEVEEPADGDIYVLEIQDEYGKLCNITFYLDEAPPALKIYPEGGSEDDTRIIVPFTPYESTYRLGVCIASDYEMFGVLYDWLGPDGNPITETEEDGRAVQVEGPVNGAVYTCTVTDSYGQTATVEYEFQYQRQEGDPTDDDMTNAKEISVGDSVDVSVTDDDPVAWFRFTPENDGKYELYSESEEYLDTYATLYNAAGMPVAQDDESAGHGCFGILEHFEAGETCYFGVRQYSSTAAQFTIHLVSGERSEWLSDYEYQLEEDRITLSSYKGKETSVTVPGSAHARGKEYRTIMLSPGMWNNDDVTSISFENGVVFPEYSDYLFSDKKKLISVDMTKADLSHVKNMEAMFQGCSSLESIDLGGVNLSSVELCGDIFSGCNKLQTIGAPVSLPVEAGLPRTYLDSEGNKYTSLPMNLETSITLTKLEESEWLGDYTYETAEDAVTLISYSGKTDSVLVPGSAQVGGKEYSTIKLSNGLWNDSSVKNLTLESGVVLPEDCSSMFSIPSLESINLRGADLSNSTSWAEMFGDGEKLQEIRTPINVQASIALPVAFSDEAGNLYSTLPQGQAESLLLTRASVSDWLADFNYEINGTRITLTSYHGADDYVSLTVPGSAVIGNKAYETIELSGGMWKGHGGNVTALDFEEGVVLPEDCTGLFENLYSANSIDIGALDWSNVTKMDRMFADCHSLSSLDLQAMDTSKVTSMSEMFMDCNSLNALELSSLDTSSVTDMSGMFRGSSLGTLDLSSFDTSKVTDMGYMFCSCWMLKDLNIEGLDTGKVTNMDSMFYNCGNLETIDLSGLDTGNVTNMSEMFGDCSSVKTINLSGLDLSSVKDMSYMFSGCDSITELDMSGHDMSSVESMKGMFKNCWELADLDLHGCDASGVTTMYSMFRNCASLTNLNMKNFEVKNVTDMSSMFRNCYNLKTLDLGSLKPEKVTNIRSMFKDCDELQELDLSGIDAAGVEHAGSIFEGVAKLARIEAPTNLAKMIYLPVVYEGSNGALYGTLPRARDTSLTLLYARNLQEGESGDPVPAAGITLAKTEVTYDGNTQKPAVTVKSGDMDLSAGTDYTVVYSNNVQAGTATVTVTGKGTFTGTNHKTFTIKPAAIAASDVTVATSGLTYNGKAITPAVTVKSGNTTLKSGTDYTVAYKNNTNAGNATVTVTGKGNYSGTVNKTFQIASSAIAASGITVATSGLTYNGKAKTPAVTVKSGNTTLKSGTDYTVAYKNNTNAGNATVTVTGKGNYSGTVNKTFKITKAAQSITAKAAAGSVAAGKTTTVSISGAKGAKAFSSSNTSVATVTSAGKVTAKKVGTVKITATSKATANYNAASKTVTIKVVPAATSKLTGQNLAKGIKLTWAKVDGANGYIVYRNNKPIKTITKGTTVTYTDAAANTNGTKYVYKIVAKASTGNSPLNRSLTFYRVARPVISSVQNTASKKATVKWGKNATATGYQIQYSLKSNFSGASTVNIGKAGTVSRVIASLTKNKTYYFRIRSYKKVGKVTYYSTWSASKSLIIKK